MSDYWIGVLTIPVILGALCVVAMLVIGVVALATWNKVDEWNYRPASIYPEDEQQRIALAVSHVMQCRKMYRLFFIKGTGLYLYRFPKGGFRTGNMMDVHFKIDRYITQELEADRKLRDERETQKEI